MPRNTSLSRRALVFHSRSSRRSLILSTLALTLFVYVIGSGVAAGQATSSLRGTVTDPVDNTIIGANVVRANAGSNTERPASTGAQGEYQFLLIPPPPYILRETAPSLHVSDLNGP